MNEKFVASVVDAIFSVTKGEAPLHAPEIRGNEWRFVKQCLDTEWVSTVGSYVNQFEADLANYTGARHAIATVNGTSALHICMLLARVTQNDEVITPSLTFVGTINAITYCGAVPHFADVEPDQLTIDADKLDAHLYRISERQGENLINLTSGRRIAAIVCMHTFGHPADMDKLMAVAQKWGLPVIEDAAESLGSYENGKHTGTFGCVSALSFNGNKIITTGGGGAILTNIDALAAHAKHLTTTAKLPHAWEFVHDQIGFNYRLPNINAALGCAQLERLNDFLEKKRQLADAYVEAVQSISGVRFLRKRAGSSPNNWLNAMILDPEYRHLRESLLHATNKQGLGTRPIWCPMHKLPMFASSPMADLSITEDFADRVILVPSSPKLADQIG